MSLKLRYVVNRCTVLSESCRSSDYGKAHTIPPTSAYCNEGVFDLTSICLGKFDLGEETLK